jgi:hypothetical protein
MNRRRLLSLVGALGLVAGLLTSGVATQADTSMSDSAFQAMVNNYLAQANNGQPFCYAQPVSTTNCPTLTQASVGSNNVAVCVQYDNTAAPPPQTCSITQANVSGDNIAIVIQVVNRRGNDAAQLATQTGTITQDDRFGNNFAAVLQFVRQSTGVASGQEDHQFATIDQNSPLTLATSFGRNFAILAESSSQYGQSGLGYQSQFSEQDVSLAGHHINQYSKGVSKAYPVQSNIQVLFGDGGQTQQIDPRCCSEQMDNGADVFTIDQSTIQVARKNNGAKNLAAAQSAESVGVCHTKGHCTITQFASDNVNSYGPVTKTCTPNTVCTSTVICANGGETVTSCGPPPVLTAPVARRTIATSRLRSIS